MQHCSRDLQFLFLPETLWGLQAAAVNGLSDKISVVARDAALLERGREARREGVNLVTFDMFDSSTGILSAQHCKAMVLSLQTLHLPAVPCGTAKAACKLWSHVMAGMLVKSWLWASHAGFICCSLGRGCCAVPAQAAAVSIT